MKAHPSGHYAKGSDRSLIDARVDQAVCQYPDHPLAAELLWLAEQYRKLEARFNKITSISDRLQEQVLETNTNLKAQAQSDQMTGLLNRLGFMEQFKIRGESLPYGLLLLNLDNLDKVNIDFGYRAGDQAVLDVASTLRSLIRSDDIVARWGGEEFMILAKEAGPDALLEVARRLLLAVGRIVVPGPKPEQLSASIGVYLCCDREKPSLGISRVDAALWQAKRQGGGRIVIYSESYQPDHLGSDLS